MIDEAVSCRTLSAVKASKLRGLYGWADTHTTKRCGRIATFHLKARQYSSESALTPALEASLSLLRQICSMHIPWPIPLLAPGRFPLVAYSDASSEPQTLAVPRLGWLLFDPQVGALPVLAKTLDLPGDIVGKWKVRDQQIFPAESFAPLAAVLDAPEFFARRNVSWFIDNEAAASTLIRGATTQEDVMHIAEATQLCWTVLRTRV